MKKLVLFLVVSLVTMGSLFAQECNVALSNLSGNNGYRTYLGQEVQGLYFLVLADGDNSSNIVPDFEVAAYLLPCDGSGSVTSSTPTYARTFTVTGLHQYGTMTFSGKTIQLNTVSGLADGTYRIGVQVNSNSAISSSVDNASDNAYLLRSDDGNHDVLTFTAQQNTGIDEATTINNIEIENAFPNPFSDNTSIAIKVNEAQQVAVRVYNTSGQLMQTIADKNLAPGNYLFPVDGSRLAQGLYTCTITAGDKVIKRTIVKQ